MTNSTTAAGYCIYLPRSMVQTIDKTRGDVPRSKWISRALESLVESIALTLENKSSKGPTDSTPQDPKTIKHTKTETTGDDSGNV
jgi:hypothetical protein